MKMKITWIIAFIGALFLGLSPLQAKERELMILQDRTDAVIARAVADVTQDRAAGLYTYAYTLHSSTASLKPVALFALEIDPSVDIQNVHSPEGWTARRCGPGHQMWCWISGSDLKTQLAPGQARGDFSFQSHQPPKRRAFFAQNLADGEDDIDESDDFRKTSFAGSTQAPMDPLE